MSDLIDRQAVIEIINKHIFYEDYGNKDKIYLIDAIENLPSAEKCPTAEPNCADGCIYGWGSDECEKCRFKCEPKTGRWITDGWDARCSECDWWVDDDMTSNYCPNCGARMEKEE